MHCLPSLAKTKPRKPKQLLCFLFSTQRWNLLPSLPQKNRWTKPRRSETWMWPLHQDASRLQATYAFCKLLNAFQAIRCQYLKTLLKTKWKCYISSLFTCSHRRLSQEMKARVACAAHPSLESPAGADTESSPASHSFVSCLSRVGEMMLCQLYLMKR